jgi:hypothetical protein
MASYLPGYWLRLELPCAAWGPLVLLALGIKRRLDRSFAQASANDLPGFNRFYQVIALRDSFTSVTPSGVFFSRLTSVLIAPDLVSQRLHKSLALPHIPSVPQPSCSGRDHMRILWTQFRRKISRTSARIAMAGRLDQCDAHQLEPFKLALVKTELELCVGSRLLSRV